MDAWVDDPSAAAPDPPPPPQLLTVTPPAVGAAPKRRRFIFTATQLSACLVGGGGASTAQCLVRASAKKRKISTLVPAGDQVRFQLAMATILKAAMLDGLKKRSKQKKKGNRKADA